MSLAVLCPSRGRPQAGRALFDSFEATKAGPGLRRSPSGAAGANNQFGAAGMGDPSNTRLIFLLDADDSTLLDYPEPQIIAAPTGDPVQPSNAAALASSADIIGWCGDDTRFLTQAWDIEVRNALKEPGVFWGWDGHDKPWPSTFFVSASIVRAIGYLILPGFKRSFWDTAWIDLATMANVARVSTLVMFHHDNSVHGGVAQDILAADQALYDRWRTGDIRGDAMKIRTVLDVAHFFPSDLITA